MNGFWVAETHILFWPTSIFITLLLVAFSIKILGHKFVKNLLKKQAWPEGYPDPSGEV
jgi:hypothetical protein